MARPAERRGAHGAGETTGGVRLGEAGARTHPTAIERHHSRLPRSTRAAAAHPCLGCGHACSDLLSSCTTLFSQATSPLITACVLQGPFRQAPSTLKGSAHSVSDRRDSPTSKESCKVCTGTVRLLNSSSKPKAEEVGKCRQCASRRETSSPRAPRLRCKVFFRRTSLKAVRFASTRHEELTP